jgi:paraquat-inducible protein A
VRVDPPGAQGRQPWPNGGVLAGGADLLRPANLYPILRMEFYAAYSESTVSGGCVKLFQDGQWVVAVIVFLASILIPLFKLLGLFFLS